MGRYSQERLESRITEAVSTMIVSGEIKNPKLSPLVSVTRIELSSDNAYATLYISSLTDDARLENSVKALQSASGFIQRRLAAVLKTKNTPVLTFKPDYSLIDGDRLNRYISEVIAEDKRNSSGEDE